MVTCLSFGPMRGPDSMENFIQRLPPFDFVYDKIQGAITGNVEIQSSKLLKIMNYSYFSAEMYED